MEEKKMTIEEVLELTVRQLQAVNIPIGLIEQVGAPISIAVQNLNACLESIRKSEEEQPEKDCEEQ